MVRKLAVKLKIMKG